MAFKQADRCLRIDTPLGEDVLLLAEFDAVEEISSLFRYDVRLLSEKPDIVFADIIGKDVTISIHSKEGDRVFHGMVCRFRQLETTLELTKYRAEIVPHLWKLDQTTDCKIFQNTNVPDIVKAVLDEGGIQHEFQLEGEYAERVYCVQYRETDFQFISRLLEEEGMYYFFQIKDGKHVHMIGDRPAAHPACPGREEARYHTGQENVLEDETVQTLSFGLEIRPDRVTLEDYNFETPSEEIRATQPTGEDGGRAELYDYPGEYGDRDTGKAIAEVRFQETRAPETIYDGTSDCRGLTPGHKFDLIEHPRRDLNQALLVLSVTHKATETGGYQAARGGDSEFAYTNEFSAMPHAVPYRPRRTTPIPRVEGPQTAVVVGPEDEKIHVDKYGRVKVKFHWDRADATDDTTSCWVRVSQAWAGAVWGSMHIPHIGHEVIVEFLEGDPDKPVITGRVYNAEKMPPLKLPEAKHKSVLRDDYGNEIVFNATPGEEYIRIFSPQHESLVEIGRSIRYRTASDRKTHTVGATCDVRLGTDQKFTAGSSHSQFFGLKTDIFVGLSVGLQIAGTVSGKAGIALDGSLAGSIAFSHGFSYKLSGGTDIAETSNFYSRVSEKDMDLSSLGATRLAAGPLTNSIIEASQYGIRMSYGLGSPPIGSPMNRGLLISTALVGLVSAGLAGTAAVLAGEAAATKGAEDDDRSPGDDSGELSPEEVTERDKQNEKSSGALIAASVITGAAAVVGAAYTLGMALAAHALAKTGAKARVWSHALPKTEMKLGEEGVEVRILTQDRMQLDAIGVTLQGPNIRIAADATHNSESKGPYNIKGTPVTINGKTLTVTPSGQVMLG
ncbi:MAG: type VI secretion system tip protein TssI/VgrG [Planctomycetota bacterium]